MVAVAALKFVRLNLLFGGFGLINRGALRS